MTESVIAAQNIAIAGVTPSYAAADAAGSKFLCPSDSRLFLHIKNTNGSTRTVTIAKQQSSVTVPGYGSVSLSDFAVTVPATTGDKMIGPIPPYCVDSDGYAHVSYDAVTNLTVALLNLAKAA